MQNKLDLSGSGNFFSSLVCKWKIDEFKGRIGPKNECILEDGQLFTMAYRKEYRMLSEEERIRYHNAMAILKRSGEFDRMCVEHFNVSVSF